MFLNFCKRNGRGFLAISSQVTAVSYYQNVAVESRREQV